MARTDENEPTLGQAWAMLGSQLGLAVEERAARSIRAQGTHRGRQIAIEIECDEPRSEFWRFLSGLNTISSRNRRETWHTVLVVGCTNPRGLVGSIESAVDVRDPAWQPGRYDPRNGRKVTADQPGLLERVLTADTHERLMSIMDDLRIHIDRHAIRIDHRDTAIPGKGANYVAGSVLHHYQGSPPPWPDRALIGPPWWIALLCDIADTVDAA